MERVAGRTGRRIESGLIEPSSFSSAYSTSDFHDSAVRSSSRIRGYFGCCAHRLEADRQEEVGRRQAPSGGPESGVRVLIGLRVAECLDRLDAALGQVAGHALDQHPAEPTGGERRDHVCRHQKDRIGRNRRCRKCHRARHVGRAARTAHTRPPCRRRRSACRTNPTPAGSATPRLPSPAPDRRTRMHAARRPGRAPRRRSSGTAAVCLRACPRSGSRGVGTSMYSPLKASQNRQCRAHAASAYPTSRSYLRKAEIEEDLARYDHRTRAARPGSCSSAHRGRAREWSPGQHSTTTPTGTPAGSAA